MKKYLTLIIIGLFTLPLFSNAQELPDFLKNENYIQGETKSIRFDEILKLKKKYDRMQAPVVVRPYDVLSYDIFLDWDNLLRDTAVTGESRYWNGEIEMKILINENNFNMLELDAGYLQIQNIFVGEEVIDPVQPSEGMLSIPLPNPANIGDTINVFIAYRYIGDDNLGFFLYQKGLYVGQGQIGDSVFVEERLAYLMNEPVDAKYWMPCNDWPHDKAVAKIRVKVPSEYTVAANGLLTIVEEIDNSKIYNWEDSSPIATYLISATASIFKEFSDWYKPEDNPEDSIEVKYYVWQKDYDDTATDGSKYNARHAVRNTLEMMRLFSNYFIPYPFVKYGIVAVQPYDMGGMEHQTLTMVNRRWLRGWDDVNFAHELAHQWLGDLITCANWNDIWINEGGASWSEGLWYAEVYGDIGYYYSLNYARQIYLWYGGIELPAIYGLEFNDLFNNALTYKKSGFVYHLLKELLGEEAYYTTLRGLLNEYKFKSLNTEQFKTYFAEHNPDAIMSFDTFFQQWIYSPGHPVYEIIPAITKIDDTNYDVQITLNQTQNVENVPEVFITPLRFNVFGPADTVAQVLVFNNQRTQDYQFNLSFQPDSIYIDSFSTLCEYEPVITSVNDYTDNSLSYNFSIYPNAINNGQTINIQFNTAKDNSNIVIDLYDYLGNKIDRIFSRNILSGEHTISYNINNLSVGIYFVKLSNNNFVSTQKLYIKE